MNFRIIPRLDIKNNNLIKGINFEGLKILGNPKKFSEDYYNDGADELILMDAVASLYGMNSLDKFLREIVNSIAIPISVGGGIKSISTIKKLMNSGADRVILNTSAVLSHKFLFDAIKYFGSSSIIVAIDYKIIYAKNNEDLFYEVYIENGKQKTGINALKWANQCQDLGVGEILFTCIDKEGLMRGADFDLPVKFLSKLKTPFLVGGGIGKHEHILETYKKTHCNGISIASFLHYKKSTIKSIKVFLKDNDVNVVLHE